MSRKSVKNKKRVKTQKGGTKYKGAINKYQDVITFPLGFPALDRNGDYDIVHSYDADSNEKIKEHVVELRDLLTGTFPNSSRDDLKDAIQIKARDIYDAHRQDFLSVVDWILRV